MEIINFEKLNSLIFGFQIFPIQTNVLFGTRKRPVAFKMMGEALS